MEDAFGKKYKFYVREFLNKEGYHEGAYILGFIRERGYTEFAISDCNRVVRLSVELSEDATDGDLLNSISKLEKVAMVATGMAKYGRKLARKRGLKSESR